MEPETKKQRSASCYVQPTNVRGRQAVRIGNESIAASIVLGGGHIALIQQASDVDRTDADDDFGSPLWVPHWPTFDPALAEAADEEIFGSGLEGKYVLQHIMGHNLCLDVFGDHSPGEVAKSGLAFHGEAGQVTWRVTAVQRGEQRAEMTLCAHLRHTCLEVTRTFVVQAGEPTVKVTETIRNLVGFQRALGRAEHVTFGTAWLRSGKVRFTANVDKGHTWPDELSPDCPYKSDVDFDYPNIPSSRGDGSMVDWRQYPQAARSEGLCTMRVKPSEERGWLVGENTVKGLALAYVWQREHFPWLMNWEENNARQDKPWDGRTVTRGLEFSSYAFPTSRERNVAMGKLHDTPCFEWLDAHEARATVFYFSLQRTEASEEPIELTPMPQGGGVSKMADPARNIQMTLF